MTRHAYYLTTRGPLPVRVLTDTPERHPDRVPVEVTADAGAYRKGHRLAVSSTFLVGSLPHRWVSDGQTTPMAPMGATCVRCGATDDDAPTSCDPYGVRNPTDQEHAR